MDRKIWKDVLDTTQPNRWPCPSCRQPNLRLIPGTLNSREGKESTNLRSHEAWEPEWIEGRFACLLECICGEVVGVVGTTGVEEECSGDPSNPTFDYGDRFRALAFQPALNIIAIPSRASARLREALLASFRLFWTDSEACANRIRATVEAILDESGVKRSTLGFKGKRVPLTLHARIDHFGKRYPALAEQLMAIKWLGNAGSHADAFTRDDLLDAYEMLEFVLEELFEHRTKRITRIARQINRSKKPRSRRGLPAN